MTQDNLIFTLFLPVALVVIMLGLGLTLSLGDFRNVLEKPKAVAFALILRIVVLPFVALGLCYAFRLEPVLAVGLMLLAAAPGGASSNLYTHLAGGDVALNITLTALNSVLAIIVMPVIVNLSLSHFLSEGQALPLQFDKMLQIFVIVVVPMALGMWLRSRFPGFADRMNGPVKLLSVLFLIAVVAIALISEWQRFLTVAPVVGLAAAAFNIVAVVIAYVGARTAGIDLKQSVSLGMEICIRNAALAIAVALSPALLNNATMAIPAAIYGLVAYLTAAAFLYWVKWLHPALAARAPSAN